MSAFEVWGFTVLAIWSLCTVVMYLWLDRERRRPPDPPLTLDDVRGAMDGVMETHFGPVPLGDEIDDLDWPRPYQLVDEGEAYMSEVRQARDDVLSVTFEDTDDLVRKLQWKGKT